MEHNSSHLVVHGLPVCAVSSSSLGCAQNAVSVIKANTVLARGRLTDLSAAVDVARTLGAHLLAGVAAALVTVVLAKPSVVSAMEFEPAGCGAVTDVHVARLRLGVVRARLASKLWLNKNAAALL